MNTFEKTTLRQLDWKKVVPYLVAIVLFIGFALLYCSPLLEGKVLHAGDVDNWKGAANEALEYKQQTGETTWWTNSMFGGMPTYQITGNMPSGDIINKDLRSALHLGFGETFGLLIGYFIGFFLMLICFGVNPWLALLGSMAIGMSSYFFIIIPAGHITKSVAIGFLAPIIGGTYALFRNKYWLGAPLIMVYGIACISLHPQMTYYVAMLIGVMLITEIIQHLIEKKPKELLIPLGVFILCFGFVMGSRISWLNMNNSYLKQTMRGGHSELTQKQQAAEPGDQQAAESKPNSGLSYQYMTDWSYGMDETFTLLVPNMMGGASGYDVGENSSLYKNLVKARVPRSQAKQFCAQAPTYWGDKPFTSGAVYIGAVVCLLFLLGALIVPGPYKWALIFATVMSILLAWGRHFPFLTHLFYDYFPMYNKFRAVESILVVAEITMPLLGFLGLQRIMEGKVEWKTLHLSLIFSGGLLVTICAVLALFGGSLFDFTSAYDAQWKGQVGDQIYQMIVAQRQAMMSADAWRSLVFILCTCSVIYLYAWMRKSFGNKQQYNIGFIASLLVLILVDMVPVDKRFFNNDNFVTAKDSERNFKIQPWEQEILKDKSLDYRVFNMAANTFNDARTSYRLKSVGGYSAAKLRRYQDLIDEHLSERVNPNVLNMLNTKYIVHPQYGVMPNPDAMGNAWFVDQVQFVASADDECAALNTIDMHTTAVADEQFRDVLNCTSQPNATDRITLTEYQPDELTYTSSCAQDRVAVFSEIYYPKEWHLYIDGEEYPLGRANYVLRAAVIPAGEHTIHMAFIPRALRIDAWSVAIIIIALLLSLGCITWPLWNGLWPKKKQALLAQAE